MASPNDWWWEEQTLKDFKMRCNGLEMYLPFFDADGKKIGGKNYLYEVGRGLKQYFKDRLDHTKLLFGINLAKEHIVGGTVIILDNELDVIKFHRDGIKKAVSSCAPELHVAQVELLLKLGCKNIVYLFENNALKDDEKIKFLSKFEPHEREKILFQDFLSNTDAPGSYLFRNGADFVKDKIKDFLKRRKRL